jgi:acetyl-CoA carboxylase, biotin carboxylase subunit
MTPFRRVLVANRGEIAVRIIRACKELNLESVQVYSEADRDSLPARMAERALCIGGVRASDSYLDAQKIVSAALTQRADAIHPGYGFLSENAAFAALCAREGITFIGPSPEAIAQMGDKATAKRIAREAEVPTIPGSDGAVRDARGAAAIAAEIGFPVLLKASAGGGGRGIRVVQAADELTNAFADAAREAKAAFGDGAIYVEKYLRNVRHVEVQILSDGETVLHLGERDCSIQRRNQKLVEESPSPVVDSVMRTAIGEAAIRLARRVGYTNAGTVEFIVAGAQFYFMEMNTRIQVEHPVTEMVTGIDIVKEQIRIAEGRPLRLHQSDIQLRGHAIECRINAEDPDKGFAPCPGEIRRFHSPGGAGVRIDSHLDAGSHVPPYYDSLLAKLVVWGNDREEAIARMRRALDETNIDGVKTTIPFHRRLMGDAQFARGDVHTRYVEDVLLRS